MIGFFQCGQVPVKTLLIDFLVHLLLVGLLGGNFHISQPLRLLGLELLAVFVDLGGLLIKHILLLLFHEVPPIFLLLLLPPPNVGLDLLHSPSVTAGCITLKVLRSYPAMILTLLGPRICPWRA